MPDTQWQPQVALITGAGSGIGRQLALTLAANGVAIGAIDIKPDGLRALHTELHDKGRKMAWQVADVTDAAALKQAVEVLERQVGPIDLAIANAGLGYQTAAEAADAAAFNAIIQVNLIGVNNTFAAALPGMLARGRGHLVGLSSLASYRGMPLMAAYCASKSGVNAILEAYRIELQPRGIFTTIVCPGWIRTPMTAKLDPKVPALDVAHAANLIVRAIQRRAAFIAFPRRMRNRLAMLRWMPRRMADWMITRMMRAAQPTDA